MCDKCFSPMVAKEAKRGFTVLELIIVVAILGMMWSAISGYLKKTAGQPHMAKVAKVHHIAREGGGDIMFRFIELFIFMAILWIIANLLHYVFMRSTGWSAEDSPMAWLFGLSTGWLKKDAQKKQEQEDNVVTKRKDIRR